MKKILNPTRPEKIEIHAQPNPNLQKKYKTWARLVSTEKLSPPPAQSESIERKLAPDRLVVRIEFGHLANHYQFGNPVGETMISKSGAAPVVCVRTFVRLRHV